MKYKEGDMIFLTQRTEKGYRGFISRSIAKLTKFPEQKVEEVKVHSAIIYKEDRILRVRDMDMDGDENYSLVEYLQIMKGRYEIVQHDVVGGNTAEFNRSCKETKVKYDYTNTFVWQLIRAVTGKWFGRNTFYMRMCAEDVQREFNILLFTFIYPEQTNPNELFKKVLTIFKQK